MVCDNIVGILNLNQQLLTKYYKRIYLFIYLIYVAPVISGEKM